MAAPTQSVFSGYISLPRGLAHRTLNGVKVVRVWYNYKKMLALSMSRLPWASEVGLLARAGRGFSPPTCIVLLLYRRENYGRKGGNIT